MNNFAISSKGVGDALQRSAAALAAAGNNIDQSIGLVTAMNSVIQNPDSVGTALKTMSMFLRAAKTDAESAGIETDGMAESVSKLQDEILALSGVDIMMADGQTFKSTFQIIEELSNVWDKLSDVSQANILNLIGGKRNANVVTSLIKNFDDAKEAMIAAQEATGSATIENEKYLDSINGKLAQLKANFEALSESLIDSEWFKGIVDVASGFLQILTALSKIKVLIPGIVAGVTAMNVFSRRETASSAFSNIVDLINIGIADKKDNLGIMQSIIPVIDALNSKEREYLATKLMSSEATRGITDDIAKNILGLGNMKSATEAAGKAAEASAGGFSKLLAPFTNLESTIMGITAIVTLISMALAIKKKLQQDSIDAGNEVSATFENAQKTTESNIKTLSDMRSEFDVLSKGVGENGENISLTSAEYERYNELLKEIINISPSVAHSYEDEKLALESYTDVIGQAIDAQRDLQEESNKTYMQRGNAETLFKGWKEEYKIATKDARREIVSGLDNSLNALGYGTVTRQALDTIGIKLDIGAGLNTLDDTEMRLLADRYEDFFTEYKRILSEEGWDFDFFSSDGNAKLEKLESDLSAFAKAVEPMNTVMREQSTYLTDYLQYWSRYGNDEQKALYGMIDDIPTDAIDEFNTLLSQSINPTDSFNKQLETARTLATSFGKAMTDSGMQQHAKDLKNGKIEIEDYNNELNKVKDTLVGMGYSEAIASAVVDAFSDQTNAIDTATDSLNNYYDATVKFPKKAGEVYDALANGNDLIAKAMQETMVDGGISADTFKELEGMMDETESVWDYIDIVNGKNHLNYEKFSMRNIELSKQNQKAIQNEIATITSELEAYDILRKAMILRSTENEGDRALGRSIIAAGIKDRTRSIIDDVDRANLIYSHDGVTEDMLTNLGVSDDIAIHTLGDKLNEAYSGVEFQYDLPVTLLMSTVVKDEDGNIHGVNDAEYMSYLVERAGEYIRGGKNALEALYYADMDTAAGGRNLILDYVEVTDGEYDAAEAEMQGRANALSDLLDAYFNFDDYENYTTIDKWISQANSRIESLSSTLGKYSVMMQSEIEEAARLGNATNLDTMWGALEGIGDRASTLQDAIKTTADGTKLGIAEIYDLVENMPELKNDPNFQLSMINAESAEEQKSILDSYVLQYENAYDSIIQAQIDALKAQKESLRQQGADDDQINNINNLITMLEGFREKSLSELFPTEEEIEPANEQMAEAISTIQEYRDLRNAIDEDARKGGKLTEGTIESLVKLFGENYEDYLSFDDAGNLIGANAEAFDDWCDTYIDGLENVQGSSAWLTEGFVHTLRGLFSIINKADTNNLDQLSDSLSKFASAGDLLARQGTADANSYDALRDLLGLIEDFEIPETNWEDYFSFGEDGSLVIYYEELTSFLEQAADDASGLSEEAKIYAKSLLNAAKETTSLSDSMSEIGGYTDLFGTISDELSSGSVNSLDTLASFIDSMETLGGNWMDYVAWDDGPIIDSAGALDLVYQRIDSLVPAGEGATDAMRSLNAELKSQAEQAIRVATATKTITERANDVKEAMGIATEAGPTLEITKEAYESLVAINGDYASAVEDVGGVLMLNKERYDEVTNAMTEYAAAMAELRAEEIETSDEYKELLELAELSTQQKNRLDSLNEQIAGYRALANEIYNASSALHSFGEADQSSTTETFGLAQDAYKVINDVLNNKDSELFGQIGSEAYQEALRSLIPADVAEGTKEFEQTMKRLGKYFGADSPLEGAHNFRNDLMEIGKSAGLIGKEGDLQGTLKDWASAFGVTEDAMAAMISQVNRYLAPENKIRLQTMQEVLDGIRKEKSDLTDEQKNGLINEELIAGSADAVERYDERMAEASDRIASYFVDDSTSAQNFIKDLELIEGVDISSGKLTKSISDIASALDIDESLVSNMITLVNTLGGINGNQLTPQEGDTGTTSAVDEMNSLCESAIKAGEAIDALNGKSISISAGGTLGVLGTVLGVLQEISNLVASLSGARISIGGVVGIKQTGGSGGNGGKAMAMARGTKDAKGGKTLVGELGMETVVDPAQGIYYTVGERGAEFVDLPKHAIVFNDRETKELFSGRTMSKNRKRGRAMAYGSFDVKVIGKLFDLPALSKKSGSSGSSNSGSGNNGSSSASTSKLEEILEKYEELIAANEHLIEHQKFLFDQSKYALDYTGMGNSLEEQVRLYRKIMEDAQKGIKKMIKAGAKDTDKELQQLEESYWSAYRSMFDTMEELGKLYTDGLNEKIDGLQGALKTFLEVAEQMSEGSISTDLLQELLDNGIQYMSLLDKVGDTYVLNEERLQDMLAAEREQLAIESAIAYVNKISIAATNENAEALANLINVTNQVGDSTWDLVYANIAQLKTLGLTDEQIEQITKNVEAMRSLASKTYDDISKEADDLYKTQRDAVDYIYDKTKELVKFELDEQIEAIEEQIDAYDEIIDKKIEMIELAKEENDYADSISEKTKELAEIQSKIDQLSLDDSREARAERTKLIAEREDLQKELDQAQQDHAHDLQVEALEKDRESYTEERESEIEELENSLSSEEKLHQAVLDRIQSGWDTLHEDLLKWNAEHGSVLNKEITENWELALQAAEKYGSYIEALDVFQNGTPSVSIGGDSTSAEDLPHYHSGGIVDDRGALNDEEVLAVLKKGEMVLNDNAKDGVFEVIDFVQELSRRLGKKIGDIASPYRSALNSIAGIPNAGGRLVAVGGSHSETFSPVFNVSISHSGNMTDADAMNYGRRIANTALDTLYDAFKGRGITDAITRQRL